MEIADKLEQSLLRPDSVEDEMRRLCMHAKDYHLAAVVVPPSWTRFAVTATAGSDVAVSILSGYPDGTHTSSVKSLEARLALEEGAREVTMVPNLAAYKSGWLKIFGEDIAYVLKQCRMVSPEGEYRVLIYVDLLPTTDLREIVQIIGKNSGHSLLLSSYSHAPIDLATVRQVMDWAGGSNRVSVKGEMRLLAEALPLINMGVERLVTPAALELVQEARNQ